MSKGMVIGFVVVLALMAGMLGFYHNSQQMTDEEKNNEFVELLESNWQNAKLKAESDGEYDNNNDLVELAGSDPQALTENQRAVLLETSYFNGRSRVQFAQPTLGWIYSEKYVVVPAALFYVPTLFGRTDILRSLDIPRKLTILPDPEQDDDWKQEVLGEIRFSNERFVIIERIDPVIDVSSPQYSLGEVKDLKADNLLYQVTQENGRIQTKHATAGGVYGDGDEKNLISASSGSLMFLELGGLYFAVRDGKFELMGMLCVFGDPVWGEEGSVYIYGLDIKEIITEIENLQNE